MRIGQITIEYLLIMLISLILISISLSTLILLKESAKRFVEKQKASIELNEIANNINALCKEQEGSQIEITSNYKIIGQENEIITIINKEIIRKEVECKIEGELTNEAIRIKEGVQLY